MSTKTTFKRISLVAVAALGFGMLSVVSASATVANTTAVTTVGTPVRASVNTYTVPVSVAMVGTGYVVGTTAWTVALTGSTYPGTGANDPKLTASATTGTASSVTAGTFTFNLTVTATSDGTDGLDGNASVIIADVATLAGTYGLVVVATSTNAATAASVAFTIGSNATGSFITPTAGSGSTNTALVQQVNGQATTQFIGGTSDTSYTVTSSGVGSIVSTTATTTAAVNLNGTTAAGGVSWTPVRDVQKLASITTSTVAGVQTLTYQPIGTNGVPGTAIKATITWGSAPAVSVQYSLVKLLDGAVSTTVTSATVDTLEKTVKNASGTQRFTIQVATNDQNNVALAGQSLVATITGPGLIGIADGRNATTASGRSLSISVLTNAYGSVSVWGDGTSGAATITITAGGVLLGTKTVTFVGAATKATATQNLFIAKAATQLGVTGSGTLAASTTVASTPALSVEVTDANGNDVASGAAVKMVSSDSTKIVVGTCVEITAAPGNFECSVSGAVAAASGASATVTFSVSSKADTVYDIVAAPLTFTVGGAVATLEVTLDKVSYGAADRMILSAVAKDSSGNAAFDGQLPYASIGSNKSVLTLPDKATTYIVNGKTATSATSATGLFAPVSSGSFTISGLTIATVAAPAGAAFSVTATVAGDTTTSDIAQAAADAAAEATDAANAATDAANAAAEAADAATAAAQDAADAVAALSTQVAELISDLRKQITSLTNLVIKIQKKVKA